MHNTQFCVSGKITGALLTDSSDMLQEQCICYLYICRYLDIKFISSAANRNIIFCRYITKTVKNIDNDVNNYANRNDNSNFVLLEALSVSLILV